MKIERLLHEAYGSDENGIPNDTFWSEIKAELTKNSGTSYLKKLSLSECKIQDDRLYFRDRLYVPDLGDSNLRRLLLNSLTILLKPVTQGVVNFLKFLAVIIFGQHFDLISQPSQLLAMAASEQKSLDADT